MRDPDLVTRAQQAAAALERAWERWRAMHGLAAEPMAPVSSYVGYSIEEPWGRPRVVFGVDAGEAELLAALLDRHECVGPLYRGEAAAARAAGSAFSPGPAVASGPASGDPRSRIPAQAQAAEREAGHPWTPGSRGGPARGPAPAGDGGASHDQLHDRSRPAAAEPGGENGAADPPRQDEARAGSDRAGDQRRSRRAEVGRPTRRERRAASRQRRESLPGPANDTGRDGLPGDDAVGRDGDAQAGDRNTTRPAREVLPGVMWNREGGPGQDLAADRGRGHEPGRGRSTEARPGSAGYRGQGGAGTAGSDATGLNGSGAETSGNGGHPGGGRAKAMGADAGGLSGPREPLPGDGGYPGRSRAAAGDTDTGRGSDGDPGREGIDDILGPPAPGGDRGGAGPRQDETGAGQLPDVRTETIAAELAGWAAGELPGQASARLAAWAAIGGVPAAGYRRAGAPGLGGAGVGATERVR